MRRTDKEMRSSVEIEDVLPRALVLRIAVCNDDGTPYIVPMSFCYHNGAIYLHSAREGKKIELFRRRSRVAFEAEVDVEFVEKGANPCA